MMERPSCSALTMEGEAPGTFSRGPSTKDRISGLFHTGLLRSRAATFAAASVACAMYAHVERHQDEESNVHSHHFDYMMQGSASGQHHMYRDMRDDCESSSNPGQGSYLISRTMPLRVQREAEAMWGTMTTFSQWSRPGVILGSSSYTSSPHLCGNACNMRAA